jgi:predicted alpha-1,2-mannosidase
MKCILVLALLVAAAAKQPQHYVNTLTGTQSRYDLSHGNTLPLVARPWGFNSWSPQTDNADGSWFFHPEDVRLFGIRCTHQPSPWIGDYGTFRIQATIHDSSHVDSWQFSSYDSSASHWLPYYWDAHLDAYSTTRGKAHLELTSTQHGAVVRVAFPAFVHGSTSDGFSQTRRILIALDDGQGQVNATISASGVPQFFGVSTQNSGGLSNSSAFGHWFTATIFGGSQGDLDLSNAVLRYGTFSSASGGSVAYFDFDPTKVNASVLTLRVATSLISLNQSQHSLLSEIGSKSFDDVALESEAEWHKLLGRVTPSPDASHYAAHEIDDQLTTFYSALYRASLFPRFLDEVSPDGSVVHFSAYDPAGAVFPGTSVSDSGFWDAYRTVYPWLSLFSPLTYGRMVNGWTNAFHEGGWLPKWSSPGYRGSMVGTMGDVSLADAIVKKVPGIDVESVWAAIRKDAFEAPSGSYRASPASVLKHTMSLDYGKLTSANDPGVGRTCLDPYLQYGFIPRDAVLPSGGSCSEVVSRSLNYMLADAAIARAAKTLGKNDDAEVLIQRAANYSLLFDSSTGFFRSRNSASGNFTEPFDEFAWGGDYTEAGAWQYRFYVPHDVSGLRALYAESGIDLCDEVELAQTIPGVVHVGAYGQQIHEMTEMTQLCWGQYEHNNQPVHHMLWMPIAADASVSGKCAQRAQRWLRRVTSSLYKPGADFACGDEDNGQMSAW